MDTNDKTTGLDEIIASLHDARRLSLLELNEMRFSGKRTVITERRLKNASKKKKQTE